MDNTKFVSSLEINSDRRSQDHPHIVGVITIAGVDYRVALWHQDCKDGRDRDYYSGLLSESKDSPKFKLKLHQFRQTEDSDPNYHTPPTKPFEGPIGNLFGYLW